MSILGKIASAWKKVIRPSLKRVKPVIREFAKDELIPKLQKRINAGAVDKSVDALIAKTILDVIDEI